MCSEPCSYYSTLGQREVANIALSHSKLLYVADKNHKCKYLIDTGAAVSVLPKSCANRISDTDCLPLVAANNTTINTYGSSKRVVDVGLKREYLWTFIVADVKQPIIGADFLIHYNLQIINRYNDISHISVEKVVVSQHALKQDFFIVKYSKLTTKQTTRHGERKRPN